MEDGKIKYRLGQEVARLCDVRRWAQGGQQPKPLPLKIHSIYQEELRVRYQVQAGGPSYSEHDLIPYEEVTSQAIIYLSTRLIEVAKP